MSKTLIDYEQHSIKPWTVLRRTGETTWVEFVADSYHACLDWCKANEYKPALTISAESIVAYAETLLAGPVDR